MSIIEPMPIENVLRNYSDWSSIIDNSDQFLGSHSSVAIMKNGLLPHPATHFREIDDSSLLSIPERQGLEIALRSWRIRDYPGKGYHLHEFQDFYLLHRDEYDPKDLSSAIQHLIHDTSPTDKAIIGIATVGTLSLLSTLKKSLLK